MQSSRHRFKKRFGQNFLQDRHVIERILAAAQLHPGEQVVEVGPGRGALTEPLLAASGAVTVCEIDPELIAYWNGRGLDGLKLLEGDVLEHDWSTLLSAPPYKMVANLPYNISTPILFKLIAHRELFSRLVLMFQREVGERLLAGPGCKEYGILSVLVQVWYDISKVVLVKPGSFYPPPRVDSLVLCFQPLEEPRVPLSGWDHFRCLVKAAFAQRRKSLRNTLSSGGWNREQIVAALEQAGIDSARRAETLSLEEFSRLSAALAEDE